LRLRGVDELQHHVGVEAERPVIVGRGPLPVSARCIDAFDRRSFLALRRGQAINQYLLDVRLEVLLGDVHQTASSRTSILPVTAAATRAFRFSSSKTAIRVISPLPDEDRE